MFAEAATNPDFFDEETGFEKQGGKSFPSKLLAVANISIPAVSASWLEINHYCSTLCAAFKEVGFERRGDVQALPGSNIYLYYAEMYRALVRLRKYGERTDENRAVFSGNVLRYVSFIFGRCLSLYQTGCLKEKNLLFHENAPCGPIS